MRQRNVVKAEDKDMPPISFVECDSSDISEEVVHQPYQKEYYHEKLILSRNKIAIKEVDLKSEKLDMGFYVYKVIGNSEEALNSVVVSKRKEPSNRVTVVAKPLRVENKIIYFSNKDQ